MVDQTEEFEKVKKEVHAIIEKMGNKVPAKAIPLLEDAIIKIKLNNTIPREALGIPPQSLEPMYQYAYNLFQNGKYDDALIIFNTLRQLDITDTRYSFAIAACYHYKKDYLDAAANYLIYKYMDPLNPIPSFHLYDCYMKTNYLISALEAIEEAHVLADRDPKYASLKEKIQLEREHLKNILKDKYQNK